MKQIAGIIFSSVSVKSLHEDSSVYSGDSPVDSVGIRYLLLLLGRTQTSFADTGSHSRHAGADDLSQICYCRAADRFLIYLISQCCGFSAVDLIGPVWQGKRSFCNFLSTTFPMPLSRVKIRWGYLIALILMLVSYTMIFMIIRRLIRETGWVTHSYMIINKLESLKSEITDAETGVRGYIITNDYVFLKPYNSGIRNTGPLYEQLVSLTKDNPRYKTRLDTLSVLIQRRLASLSAVVKEYQQQGFKLNEKILANRQENRMIMDSVRLLITQLQDEESMLVTHRDKNLSGIFKNTANSTIVSLVIALITISYSVIIYNRENKAKEKAISNARNYSLQLEERVVELDRVNNELQELKSIEKFAATGRIARTMAHEVRNPLTNISLASEQLKEITGQQEEADMLLDMIGRNVNRINQLVSDLLNSTRFAQLEYTHENINDLLDETLELAKDRIDLNHIQVSKFYARDLCTVYVDKEKIKLAFLNIIVNAIEAMERTSGQLEIRTRKAGSKCQVEIHDNGIGMDEETIQRLFEPYFTGKLSGNGLGLTNTQNIILNHKGNIQVKSKVGQGSVFIVTLALHSETTSSPEV